MTFEFLNVPTGGGLPVKEIFLKKTIVSSASLRNSWDSNSGVRVSSASSQARAIIKPIRDCYWTDLLIQVLHPHTIAKYRIITFPCDTQKFSLLLHNHSKLWQMHCITIFTCGTECCTIVQIFACDAVLLDFDTIMLNRYILIILTCNTIILTYVTTILTCVTMILTCAIIILTCVIIILTCVLIILTYDTWQRELLGSQVLLPSEHCCWPGFVNIIIWPGDLKRMPWLRHSKSRNTIFEKISGDTFFLAFNLLIFSPRNQQHHFAAKHCWIWGKGFLKTSQVHLRVIRQLTIKKQTTTKMSLMKVLTPHILGPKSTLPISSSYKRKVLAPFKLNKWFYACLLWTLKPLSLLTWGRSS